MDGGGEGAEEPGDPHRGIIPRGTRALQPQPHLLESPEGDSTPVRGGLGIGL